LLFEPSETGEIVLMRRERPVVLRMEGLTSYQKELASIVTEFFSRASDLPFKVSSDNWNLFIMRVPSLNDGDTVSSEVLKKFGLPQYAIDLVQETKGWSGGCGFYSFRTHSGRISLSIAAFDERLTDKQTTLCLLKMIAATFGINPLRLKDNAFSLGAHFITYILEISTFCSKDYENGSDRTTGEKEFVTKCMNKTIEFHFGAHL